MPGARAHAAACGGSEPTRWRPVFEGPEAERLTQLAVDDAPREIARSLDAGFDLAGGAAGAAILLGELERAGYPMGERSAAAAIAHASSRAAEQMQTAGQREASGLGAGLWQGVGGLRWAQVRLGHEDRLARYDSELLSWLGTPDGRTWDVISGTTGIGVLGLELARSGRGHAIVDDAVRKLAEDAVEDADGVSWRPVSGGHPHNIRDLGVAHGQLGPIGFLAGAVDRPGARPLLEAAISWLLRRIQPPSAISAFASFVDVDRTETGRSRLAWCYGDLGAATVLIRAAVALDDTGLADLSREIALRAVERKPDDTGVRDATLCHGAAGVGHLFARLWHYTDAEPLRDAAERWLRTACELRSVAGVDGLYPMWVPNRGLVPSPAGLLNAGAGVCLILLAATSDRDPEWDRIMLAS